MKKGILIVLVGITMVCHSCETKEEEFTIPEEDEIVFEKVRRLADEAEKKWPGFDYVRSRPFYLILRDQDGANPRGYLVSPSLPVPGGSVKVGEGQSFGLALYRNDSFLEQAYDVLGVDGLFNFGDQFSIQGFPHFLLRSKPMVDYNFYDDFKGVDGNWIPLILVHEMFHTYQLTAWKYPPDAVQDFLGYPLTVDVMTYELALFDLMNQAHHVTGPEAAREFLARFVVLFEELADRDPSSLPLIESMGSFQQFLEGSARFVEHFSAAATIYPNINLDPTHGWNAFLGSLTTETQIRHVFAIRAWYHIGSGVIHLLKEAGAPFHHLMSDGITPYAIASGFLNLSAEEKSLLHSQLISKVGWNAYVLKATYLHSLL